MSKVIPSREPDFTFPSHDFGDNKYWFKEMIHVDGSGGINYMVVNEKNVLCMVSSYSSSGLPVYLKKIQEAYQSWCVESILLT